MKEQLFQEVLLSMISTNPQNPRKSISGPMFDELVASIEEKGVIEPIILRQLVNRKTPYEVVAGERRFKAACLIAEKNKERYRIPAVIRYLSDDEAFDFMTIENLQREDLTSYEESLSFKQYFEKRGKASIPELAKRIGKSAGYIRRKIAVLYLPAYIIKAWEKDKLHFSHLELLRRLKNPIELKEAFNFATGGPWREGPVSKKELKNHIDNLAPALKDALFDWKKDCASCEQNSDVQKKLWDIESMEGTHCLDKACFKQKQNNYLAANWKQLKYRRRFGTNGFRFSEGTSYSEYKRFSSWGTQPVKKCKTCEFYLTIIHIEGKLDEGRACFGDPSCFGAIGKEEKKVEREKTNGPRVTWHGEHFREEFMSKRIPERCQEFDHSDIRMARMALFAFVKSDGEILTFMAKKIKFKESYRDNKLFERIGKMDLNEIQELMKQCALVVIMKTWPVRPEGRLAVARHLGIDLLKEFAVTKKYLEKKTIAEMLKFGEKSGIFKQKKAQDYLTKTLKKKPGGYPKCKKTELISVFLKSGVELIGKIPDEIRPKR